MNDITRPTLESYWVRPGDFLAGEYPGRFSTEATRQNIDAFLDDGFNTFIDLTMENELEPYELILLEQARYYGIAATHQRFPIGDFGLPTHENMTAILNAIDSALAAGRKVYVHCWGGIGRTGTTVGCYLVRHGASGQEALTQLAKWWKRVPKSQFHPYSPETRDQIQFILNWNEEY